MRCGQKFLQELHYSALLGWWSLGVYFDMPYSRANQDVAASLESVS
jgi:hypothetical protein